MTLWPQILTALLATLSLVTSGAVPLHQVLEGLQEPAEDGGKLWVLLAAGSSSWGNYRHQADVCHSYQIVKGHGVPDERVVVFMRDDIANNALNPRPGEIINKPNGPNVYPGVPKDYTGKNLDPQIFLDVLAGKDVTMGSKKTIKSTHKDTIFVYFADHGAPGLVQFGDKLLYAKNLTKVLVDMHKESQFARIVFYWESCEAGSMFEDRLPNDMNVLAITAANSTVSSYACYFDDKISVFLGDCFSVNWMEDTDAENVKKETIKEQYLMVKNETTQSPVMQYGDKKLLNLKVADIVGHGGQSRTRTTAVRDEMSSAPQHHTRIYTLINQFNNAEDDDQALQIVNQLHDLESNQHFMRDAFSQIIRHGSLGQLEGDEVFSRPIRRLSVDEYDACYYPLVDKITEICFPAGCNDYLMFMLTKLTNICGSGVDVEKYVEAIEKTCKAFPGGEPVCGIH